MDRHHHDGAAAPGLAAPALPPAPAAGLAPLGTDAAAPAGLSPPQVGAPQAGGDGEGRGRDQGKTDSPDCAVQQPGDQPGAEDGKRFATLRARLALTSWSLTRTDAGDGPVTYYATRGHGDTRAGQPRRGDRVCPPSGGAGMKRNATTTTPARVHPLLFDACRCGPAGRLRCLACWRWFKHYSTVMQRRRAWGAPR